VKRSRELNDILDDCLERLARGEGVAGCVDRYPGHAEELVPLLEVAAATMRAVSSVSYSLQAKERGLNRLTGALARRGAPRERRFPWLAWWPRVARPLVLSLVAALFATGTAFGTAVASSDSVPGEPLYWVKTKREQISLMLPRSDLDRAHAYIRLARVRGQEMSRLVAMHRFFEAELVSDRMRRHLNESAAFAGLITPTNPIEMPLLPARLQVRQNVIDLMVRLEQDGGYLREQLLELHRVMSPSEGRRLSLLRRRSELGYRTFVSALEHGGSPSWGPFWRTEPPRHRHR
jgi:hypothetical protein